MGHFFPVVFVFWDSHTTEEMFFVRGFFFSFFYGGSYFFELEVLRGKPV